MPFIWADPHVDMGGVGTPVVNGTAPRWLGTLATTDPWDYADLFLLLIFGGIPWQVSVPVRSHAKDPGLACPAYFQRVLGSKTVWTARVLSVLAGLGCMVLAVPPAIVGVLAQNVDWEALNASQLVNDNPSLVLPLTIAKCTPPGVTFVALGRLRMVYARLDLEIRVQG